MARAPRPLVDRGLYHVYDLGNRHQVVFTSDTEREDFLLRLGVIAHERGWSVLAWCLMDNHFHLLLRTREPDLGHGMRELLGGYAAAFNRRHRFRGHLFHGRYGAKLVQDDRHLHAELRYVALNPVKAGMVRRPEDHPWSSYGIAVHGLASTLLDRRALLDLLDPFDDERALLTYTTLVTGAPTSAPQSEEGARPVVALARALGAPVRWRLLEAVEGGALDVAALTEELGLGPTVVYKHARVLREVGLLESRKEGRRATYALSAKGQALLDAVRG